MGTLAKTILRSDELSCPSCISNIQTNLNSREGVGEATVHFSTGRIEVAHDADMVSEQDLVEAVRQSGYESTSLHFNVIITDPSQILEIWQV